MCPSSVLLYHVAACPRPHLFPQCHFIQTALIVLVVNRIILFCISTNAVYGLLFGAIISTLHRILQINTFCRGVAAITETIKPRSLQIVLLWHQDIQALDLVQTRPTFAEYHCLYLCLCL